jgi:DNA-binding transcriptional LysR family regulator
LARLREILGDPLLVKSRQGQHVLTARAEALRPALARAEGALDRVFGECRFDPSTARRVFNVGATEYAMTVLAPDLMRRVQAQAPHCTLHFHPPGSGTLDALEEGRIDICFWAPEPPGEPFHFRKLYREHLVGVVAPSHPLAREAAEGGVTLDSYLAFPHIALAMGVPGANPLDRMLAPLGKSRRIACIVAHFSAAAAALAGSDLVMSMPSRLAGFAEEQGLVRFALPFTLPEYDYGVIWHPRTGADLAIAWLRGLVR